MAALLVLVAALLSGNQPREPADLFADLFARSPVHDGRLTSLRASFVETTTSTLLVAPIVARGTLVAAPPGRLAMTYTSPEPKRLVVNANRLVITWPGTARREELNIARTQQRVQRYFAQASAGELRKHFDVRVAAASDLDATYLVTMTPRRKQIRQGVERLDIWVDRDAVLLRQMRMTFPGGDSKVIRLDDIEQNVRVSDDLFEAPR